MKVDEKTSQYFNAIQQVFLYLSDKCNLLCKQCLYKPNVIFAKSIPFETACELLRVFKELGAYKLSILGGEISLYDIENKWEKLKALLVYARQLGFEYIRIDTNGQIDSFFQDAEIMQLIDEVSFSIDGYDEATNDSLRGTGAFDKAINSIKWLLKENNRPIVNITSCVAKQNAEIAGGIYEYIMKMSAFSKELGIDQLNFHGVFRMGVPMDAWAGECGLDVKDWFNSTIKVRKEITERSEGLRFPLHVVSKSEFDTHSEYYGYCPCKRGERALIHPDGIIRVCSSMLSSPYGVAHFNDREIVWNEYNNELQRHEMNKNTPCTNQTNLYTDELCPICFSIKPFQKEIVWNKTVIE